jgi:hypothetical protein
MNNLKAVCSSVLFAVLCVVAPAAMAITIDAFTDPLPPNADLPGSGQRILFVGTVFDPPSAYVSHMAYDAISQVSLSGVLKGDRYVELLYVSGTATVAVTDGLAFSNDVGGRSTLDIQYGKTMDLNADLTVYAGSQLEINIIDGDMWAGPRPLACTITVTSLRGTPEEATASVTKDLVDNGLHGYLFSSFTGVDFTHVDTIRIVLDASQAAAIDVRLGPLETDGDPVPVAPTTWGAIKSLWQ